MTAPDSPPRKPEAFISLDVEYDGVTPVRHSMRSLAVVLIVPRSGGGGAAIRGWTLSDRLYLQLLPLPDHEPDPETMTGFWNLRPDAWRRLQVGAIEATVAMDRLNTKLLNWQQNYTLKWVAGPASSDWKWLDYYWHSFGPEEKVDIGFFCHDLTSLLRTYMIMTGVTDERAFQDRLAEHRPKEHHALADAERQAIMYINLRHLLERHRRLVQASTLALVSPAPWGAASAIP